MPTDVVIVRYAELGLKGRNRNIFENRLVDNIRACLKDAGIAHSVSKSWGRIYVRTDNPCLMLQEVFGIASFSPAMVVPPDLQAIKEAALPLIAGFGPTTTFRVSCQRGDKDVLFRSQDAERELGAFIVEKTGAKVKLRGFMKEVALEFYEGKGYIFADRIPGPGGLPLGSSGDALLLYEGRDGLAAGWLMMKRGVALQAAFISGDRDELEMLGRLHHGKGFRIHEAGMDDIPALAKRLRLYAVVSSQDVDTLSLYPFPIPALRPLVGYSKGEIGSIISRVLGNSR